MSTGTSGNYWSERNLPSALKHKLLAAYIPPFGGMTGSRTHEVVYLDGYAGEGRYANGEPGSAEIAMRVAASHLASHKLRWTSFFVEKEPASFARLQQVAEDYRAQGVDSTVHRGNCDEILDQVLTRAIDLPLFLFLDPCGLCLPFDRLVHALNRPRNFKGWPRTELLMNFSMMAVRRLGGNARSDKGQEASSQRFDEVCGGTWWRDLIRDATDGWEMAVQTVATEYASRLEQKTGMFVHSVPVAKAPHHKPIYHLVFATRSQHGLWVFGDAAARARDAWWDELEEADEAHNPDQLFSLTSMIRPDPAVVRKEAVPKIADNIARILQRTGQPVRLVDQTREVFGDFYGRVTDPTAREAVKLLHKQGRTPTTGVGGQRKNYDLVVEPPR
ncbi:three-Cys-motif partner protein TcmP [Kitasatospora sp. NPDC001660]